MTKYLDSEFSVALGSKDYRNNWDAIFNKSSVEEKVEEPLEESWSFLYQKGPYKVSLWSSKGRSYLEVLKGDRQVFCNLYREDPTYFEQADCSKIEARIKSGMDHILSAVRDCLNFIETLGK